MEQTLPSAELASWLCEYHGSAGLPGWISLTAPGPPPFHSQVKARVVPSGAARAAPGSGGTREATVGDPVPALAVPGSPGPLKSLPPGRASLYTAIMERNMAYDFHVGPIPLTTIQRLPGYIRLARTLRRAGREVVTSHRLGELLGLDETQVRKDFRFLGITGKARSGFPVDALVERIEHYLQWDRVQDAALVGVGHLGKALLGYDGFAAHGINISCAFDRDPALVGSVRSGLRVRSIDDLEPVLRAGSLQLAILAVSPESAQELALRLARAGVLGIWNFTGCTLYLPDPVIVQDQDIAIGLAVLSAKLSARDREGTP